MVLYPREIEEFLYTHPDILHVEVVGVPDVKYGEQVLAAVIAKEGRRLTAEEVKTYCRGRIARHKIPHYIMFLDRFPMTASGKVKKFVLRDRAIETYGLRKAEAVETA